MPCLLASAGKRNRKKWASYPLELQLGKVGELSSSAWQKLYQQLHLGGVWGGEKYIVSIRDKYSSHLPSMFSSQSAFLSVWT